MKTAIVLFVAGMAAISSAEGAAQRVDAAVQLLDRTTGTPIAGVDCQCGAEKAVSDARGWFRCAFGPADTLFLSHVAYGDWYLTGRQLHEAVEEGVIYRAEQAVRLQPVTVIALRSLAADVERLGMSVHDRLSHDGGAVLNQTAVVSSIRKSGSYGFDPVMRGFKYDQLDLIINGAHVAAACPNRMDPPASQVAPNMMEAVTILKGPHSFRYGTSFGGTIRFESSPHRYPTQQELYGRLSSSTESNDGIYRTEGLLGFRGPRWDLAFPASFSRGADYEDGTGVPVAASFRRASFGSMLGVRMSESQQLSFTVTHNQARDTDFAALPMDLRSDETWLLDGRHRIAAGRGALESWNTNVFLTRVDHRMDNLRKVLNPRQVNAGTEADTRSYGARTEAVWSLSSARLFAGLDASVEEADGRRSREFLMGPMAGRTVVDNVWNGARVTRAGVFGEYHHAMGHLNIIVSGRVQYDDANARDADPGFSGKTEASAGPQLNPSLSIGGRRDLDNGMSLGLWFGRAQRSAGLTERYINSFPVGLDPYDMLGNPNLDPEVNNQLDLTFGFETPHTAFDVAVFASFLQDYIFSEIDPALRPTMPSSPGVRRFVNIDQAFMTGFELTWARRLGPGLQYRGDVAYTWGKDRVRGEPLPEIAPLDIRNTLSGSYVEGTLRPMIMLRLVSRQDRISAVFGETATPSFAVLDLGVSFDVLENLGVNAGLRNLFDEAYYEHLNRAVQGGSRPIFAPGRNAYVTVALHVM